MDNTDYRILEILQKTGRISMKDLGKTVGLTAPAVSERVKKMEDAGIIMGYKARINHGKLGKTISAFIDLSMPSESYAKFIEFAEESDSVVECHHVTGGDSLIVKVLASNIVELEALIDSIKRLGKTNTSIILSSPIIDKAIQFDE